MLVSANLKAKLFPRHFLRPWCVVSLPWVLNTSANYGGFYQVNQAGEATTTASNSASTGTTTSGSSTTSSATPVGSQASSSSTSSSNNQKSSGGSHLATGAIAGIAVGGAIVIAALVLVLWKCCTRKAGSPAQQNPTYETAAERPYQAPNPPIHEYKVSPVVATQQMYQQSPRLNEVSGDNRHVGRAEMEP
jgi:hypothetical protein